MSARFDREHRVEREFGRPGRLVFPPFLSYFPLPAGLSAPAAKEPNARPEEGPRILYIEDDRFIADMYRIGLESGGWNVEVAHDGEEGLRRALAEPPALVLLDVLLPRLNGLEVLRRLRENGLTRDIPVLIVSNSSGLGGREEEARTLGIVDWMVKANTTPAALANRVKRILNLD